MPDSGRPAGKADSAAIPASWPFAYGRFRALSPREPSATLWSVRHVTCGNGHRFVYGYEISRAASGFRHSIWMSVWRSKKKPNSAKSSVTGEISFQLSLIGSATRSNTSSWLRT